MSQTNFCAVFDCLIEKLNEKVNIKNEVSEVVVLFLTDGKDSQNTLFAIGQKMTRFKMFFRNTFTRLRAKCLVIGLGEDHDAYLMWQIA